QLPLYHFDSYVSYMRIPKEWPVPMKTSMQLSLQEPTSGPPIAFRIPSPFHQCRLHSSPQAMTFLPYNPSAPPHPAFLFAFSALALVLILPHLLIIFFCLKCMLILCSFEPSATIPMKKGLHPNCSASFFRVLVTGSAALNSRIFAKSSGLR